jgi:tetratricopeptide (TPR) repeat protein
MMANMRSTAEPRRKRAGSAGRRRSPANGPPKRPDDGDKSTPWFLRWPLLALGIPIVLVYVRIFSAGFVVFDDDFQVYANPFLNPPTLQSVARFWQHSYQHLYVPLAYTILAAVARFAEVPGHLDRSIGHAVSLDPTAFHVVGVALQLANAWLCFRLVHRLTARTQAAWLCSLVFALHPLQVESVAWISELRGLTSAAYNNLGETALANGDLTEARADFEAGVARDPTLVKAYINLAEVNAALNRPEEAERAIDQVMKLPDKTSDDLSNLASY